MNKISLILISILAVACSTSKSFTSKKSGSKAEYFSIEVHQDGKQIQAINNEILLKKSPFVLYVNFIKTQGIDVSASWGKDYYDFPSNENIYNCNNENYSDDCRFWNMKAGAEEPNNINKDILVGNLSYQFHWAYDKQNNWKKFNTVELIKKDLAKGTMLVENIFDLDKRDLRTLKESEYNYPVENIDKDIYFVFATSHYEKGMEYPQELQREQFVLKFED